VIAMPGDVLEKFLPTITDHLRSSPYSRNQVEMAVRWQVGALQQAITQAPSWGMQATNKEYAEVVSTLIRELRQKIEGAPPGTDTALLVAGLYGGRLPRPEKIDWVAVERYRAAFLAGLNSMQRGCAAVARMGDYHTLDPAKHQCANSALELIVGLEAGRPANTDNSPLRVIANSLFELVAPERVAEWLKTHKEPPDLRTQCDEARKHWLGHPDLKQHCQELRVAWFTGMIALNPA
jgi:hypothetical protein